MSEISESFFQLMENHRSVRSFRAQAVIPAEHERRIVSAAQRSSTSCNLQTYAFLSIKDPGTRGRPGGGLRRAEVHPRGRPVFRGLRRPAQDGNRHFPRRLRVLPGPLPGVLPDVRHGCGHRRPDRRAGRRGAGLRHLPGRLDPQPRRPGHPDPPAAAPAVPAGGAVRRRPPAGEPAEPARRLPLEGVLFQERYDPDRVEAAVRSYDRTMEHTGCYCGREFSLQEVAVAAGETRREDSRPAGPGGYGWIEHSARRVCSRNPEHARPNLSAVLRQAGFGLE